MDYRVPFHRLPWLTIFAIFCSKFGYFFFVAPTRWVKREWGVICKAATFAILVVLVIVLCVIVMDLVVANGVIMDGILDKLGLLKPVPVEAT